MEALIYCGKCGKRLEVAEFGKGKQAKCVRCGVSVPVPSTQPVGSQLRLFCSQCGGRLSAPAEHAGEEMICPSCRLSITLPLLETADQDAGDTQPLLPAIAKGDTDGMPAAGSGAAGTATPPPLPDVVRTETQPIDVDEALKVVGPIAISPAPEDAPSAAVAQRGDIGAVMGGGASAGETQPISEIASSHAQPKAGDEDAAALEERRRQWMESVLDQFVEKNFGEWKTGDLIELSEHLSRGGYRYLDIVALNTELQRRRDAYHETTDRHMDRLREGELVEDFVDEHQGRWNDNDLSELIRQIKAAKLWPIKLPALNKFLEECRQPWKVEMAANLKRLVKDGMLKEYIESRRGGWTQEGWKDLMKQLDERGYSPCDPTAVAMALRRELTLCARNNLARLQQNGVLAAFVAEHKGEWTRDDLQKLLRKIEDDGYAPIVNLGEALDAERERWAQESGASS